jgi:hypothetical protein
MKKWRRSNVIDRIIAQSLFVAILLCACLVPELVFACSCASPSLEDKFESSENVFTALITGGEATNERVGNSPKLRTFFDVTETFKGTVPFEHFSSHSDGNSCGISLQVGVEYLIYAPDTGKIGLCSGIVVVSGESEQAAAAGSKYVDALRAFKSGQNESLAEPWQFFEQQGICMLSARFPYGEMKWPASIRVTYWTRVPDAVVPNPDKPHLKAGFTEMTVAVPGRDDLTDYPLMLSVGDQEYTAKWKEVEYSRARYFVDSDDVPSLIADLADANKLRMKSAHPKYGGIDTEASLVNAGDSVSKMRNCISSRPENPVKQ